MIWTKPPGNYVPCESSGVYYLSSQKSHSQPQFGCLKPGLKYWDKLPYWWSRHFWTINNITPDLGILTSSVALGGGLGPLDASCITPVTSEVFFFKTDSKWFQPPWKNNGCFLDISPPLLTYLRVKKIHRTWVNHYFLGGWFQIFFCVHPYLGKIPILTNIFQMGWNHQLVLVVVRSPGGLSPNRIHPIRAIEPGKFLQLPLAMRSWRQRGDYGDLKDILNRWMDGWMERYQGVE